MYLKSFTIENYRKYGITDNTVSFAANVNGDSLIGSTLIIGQNNAGKTSIVTALKKASGADKFRITDFNYHYLHEILDFFYSNLQTIKAIFIDGAEVSLDEREEKIKGLCPCMKFGFEFSIDIDKADSDELLTNIAPLIKNEIDKNGSIRAYVKYELKEQIKFIVDLYSTFCNLKFEEDSFNRFLGFLDSGDFFQCNVYTDSNCTEKAKGFSINSLVKVNTISFEKLHNAGRLSAAFNKIYNYKVKNNPDEKKRFQKEIENINKQIDDTINVSAELSNTVNSVVKKTVALENSSMLLKANLTMDTLLGNVIKYVYKDGKFEIPEDQFGMGYTNLMLIIAELVDYVENSPESMFKNTINLLIIEEPESYMHPQMQKLLIKNLNDAVIAILSSKEQETKLNCQMIITSHSANIVQGKLQTEDTFNNINYVNCPSGDCSIIIPLNDAVIVPSKNSVTGFNEDEQEKIVQEQFKYLKRHIKYSCCELFFADACIAVEGYSEETVLPYFIEKDDKLSKRYISVLNVNGAYAYTYKNLFKALRIPVAIITDIDIEGTADNEESLTSLDNKKTTNSTLVNFGFSIGTDFEKQEDNVFVVTQNKVGECYPTSFEEALILTNLSSPVMERSLIATLPRIYDRYKSELQTKAHYVQKKISANNKKAEFATHLLYNAINKKADEEFYLPEYMCKALDFISSSMKENVIVEETVNE